MIIFYFYTNLLLDVNSNFLHSLNYYWIYLRSRLCSCTYRFITFWRIPSKEAFSHLTSSCIFYTDKKNSFLLSCFWLYSKREFHFLISSLFLILYCFYHNATDLSITINFVIIFFLSV